MKVYNAFNVISNIRRENHDKKINKIMKENKVGTKKIPLSPSLLKKESFVSCFTRDLLRFCKRVARISFI
jgi:hypothetical protein